jgi:hypothetical protein
VAAWVLLFPAGCEVENPQRPRPPSQMLTFPGMERCPGGLWSPTRGRLQTRAPRIRALLSLGLRPSPVEERHESEPAGGGRWAPWLCFVGQWRARLEPATSAMEICEPIMLPSSCSGSDFD